MMNGKLHLPTTPELIPVESIHYEALPDTLAIISILIMITLLRKLVGVFPSIMACLFRWKESVNIEASAKLSRDRNVIAAAMILPFCLICSEYRLFSPAATEAIGRNGNIGITVAIMTAYILSRLLAEKLFRPHKMNLKVYATGNKAAYSFFIMLTLSLLAIGGIADIAHIPTDNAKYAMLWVSAIIYSIFVIRKTQIFTSSCSVFTAILYLCALEFIPTGTLVVSALIF